MRAATHGQHLFGEHLVLIGEVGSQCGEYEALRTCVTEPLDTGDTLCPGPDDGQLVGNLPVDRPEVGRAIDSGLAHGPRVEAGVDPMRHGLGERRARRPVLPDSQPRVDDDFQWAWRVAARPALFRW